MTALVSIFVTFWKNLPWIAIALMAVFAWLRQKDSRAMILQAVGALGYFTLVIGEWLVVKLLDLANASPSIENGTENIFGFLLFISLAVFATGYCLEKLQRRSSQTLPVTATRVG